MYEMRMQLALMHQEDLRAEARDARLSRARRDIHRGPAPRGSRAFPRWPRLLGREARASER